MGAPRALVWDARNTSSVIVARALQRRGWIVDALFDSHSPWGATEGFSGSITRVGPGTTFAVEQVLAEHPLDALFLHGDDHVRFLLARWDRLPAKVLRHLPPRDSLEVALSKNRSLVLAGAAGLPVLETFRTTTPLEVRRAVRDLAGRDGEAIVKGDGGSAGNLVRVLRRDEEVDSRDWERLTRHSPVVLVQQRLTGRRVVATAVFEHGVEQALCVHEKLRAGPDEFGVSAAGVTLRLPDVEEQAAAVFRALHWHGLADADFREDTRDGRFYFLEVNPRVPSSIGIQALAGVDVVNAWAQVCLGRGAEAAPGRSYREGVFYRWTTPDLARALRRPWELPLWVAQGLFQPAGDWRELRAAGRFAAVRAALWLARHGRAT